jgi:predicted HAD superfamily Cof-like phosphohydrolase
MSLIKDVDDFLTKFELERLDAPGFHEMLDQRIEHLYEEMSELGVAKAENDKAELVDALLDVVYIAIGTAILCGYDVQKHWDEIQRANMSKVRGMTKRGHGFDVCKPEGWIGPQHDNILGE